MNDQPTHQSFEQEDGGAAPQQQQQQQVVIEAHIREPGAEGQVVVRRFLKGKLLGKVSEGVQECRRVRGWVVDRQNVGAIVVMPPSPSQPPLHTPHPYYKTKTTNDERQGGFAKCYWATCLETGEAFALKIVQKSSLVKSRARQKARRV